MNFNDHPEASANPRERALLIAHEFADVLKVREEGGNNRGPWVKKFLNSVGLGEGFAWCAAFCNFCLRSAGVPRASLPEHPASVFGWRQWAAENGRLTPDPDRGDLFFWLDGDHGHIGFFVGYDGVAGRFVSLEGNSGPDGGRDGDGCYRKTRNEELLSGSHQRFGFISLKGI